MQRRFCLVVTCSDITCPLASDQSCKKETIAQMMCSLWWEVWGPCFDDSACLGPVLDVGSWGLRAILSEISGPFVRNSYELQLMPPESWFKKDSSRRVRKWSRCAFSRQNCYEWLYIWKYCNKLCMSKLTCFQGRSEKLPRLHWSIFWRKKTWHFHLWNGCLLTHIYLGF